jgi:hypothetical protein
MKWCRIDFSHAVTLFNVAKQFVESLAKRTASPPGIKALPSYRFRWRVIAGSPLVDLHWSRREFVS